MRRRTIRATLGALVLASVALVPLLAAPSSAQSVRPVAVTAPTPGPFRIDGRTVYDVAPKGRAVHVTVELQLSNLQPPVNDGNLVRSLYLPRFAVPVLTEATNIVATRDGVPLSVARHEGPVSFVSILDIDLSPDLVYPATQNVRLTYDLPSLPPRSDGLTRVNPAFATFMAWAIGDPGLTDVEIRLPASFEVEILGPPFEHRTLGGKHVYASRRISDPDSFTAIVLANDDDKLVEKRLRASGNAVNIRAWPGDRAWRDFVTKQVRSGVPALIELIGRPWPIEDELDVLETVSPYLYGYAGYYSQRESLIAIGDILEPEVILHELAHVWFNQTLFKGRWINEGFAQEYGTRVARQLGDRVDPPQPVPSQGPGLVRLNLWFDPSVFDVDSEAREAFGYNAAWHVVHELVEDIGVERMGDVLAAASLRTISYAGDPAPEAVPGAPAWRQLLDLLENVGRSERAARLFDRYVVTKEQRTLLSDRAEARRQYAALAKAGDGWSPPFAVRQPMAQWTFEKAETAIERARDLLAVRDRVAAVAGPLGLSLDGFERDYETARDMEDLEIEARTTVEAAEAIREADDEVNGGHDVFTIIGLWGSSARDHLESARREFADGSPAFARDAAARASGAVSDASAAGQLRLVGALGVVVLALLVRRSLALGHRRRRDEAIWRETVAALEASAGGWLAAPDDPPFAEVADRDEL